MVGAGQITAYKGIDPTNPIDASAGANTANSDSMDARSVTTAGANEMVVDFHLMNSNRARHERRPG